MNAFYFVIVTRLKYVFMWSIFLENSFLFTSKKDNFTANTSALPCCWRYRPRPIYDVYKSLMYLYKWHKWNVYKKDFTMLKNILKVCLKTIFKFGKIFSNCCLKTSLNFFYKISTSLVKNISKTLVQKLSQNFW